MLAAPGQRLPGSPGWAAWQQPARGPARYRHRGLAQRTAAPPNPGEPEQATVTAAAQAYAPVARRCRAAARAGRCFAKRLRDGTSRTRTEGMKPMCRPQPTGPGRATGEPLCLQGGRLTPQAPALRTSHCRACHHHTAQRYRRSRPRSSRRQPSPSAPGCALRGRFEETPHNHLTPTAKRTRSGRVVGTNLPQS